MVSNLKAFSGRVCEVDTLTRGHYQYMDRQDQFNYIPEELQDALHIRTHGNDKLIPEDEPCLTFQCDRLVDVYVLYPDIQPTLPAWLMDYERTRLHVTRMDTEPGSLKGYFGVYHRRFAAGEVVLWGNSPRCMLSEGWYVDTFGSGYCMYTACIKPAPEYAF